MNIKIKTAITGALIEGIVGPMLIPCWDILPALLKEHNHVHFDPSSLIGSIIFFMFFAGPGAASVGALMGYFVNRWVHNGATRNVVLWRAAMLNACLGIVVLWMSLAFFYSFGAAADHLSIFGWLTAFGPLVVPLLPRALIIGAICGILIGLVLGRKKNTTVSPKL